MRTSKNGGLPAGLEGVRRRLERWRQSHTPPSRIPETLWAAAAAVAGRYGVHRTCRVLRLDYYSLKERVEARCRATRDCGGEKAGDEGVTSVPAFLELPAAAGQQRLAAVPESGCRCMVELEDAAGAKMRIQWRSAEPPDLAALSRSFWNPAS
jgi:hypothetical protein